jgi:sugar fermentation stimulation protein A
LLANLKSKGIRAIQLYVVQREDATYFKIAKDIDEVYQEAFEHAKRVGVEVLVFRSEITKKGIKLSGFSPSVL